MKKSTGLVIVLLLAAYALRLASLGDQAVWWDEAWSAWVAQQDFATTTFLTARDVHPPLYQWTLHAWVRLAGISEFSLRYLSVLYSLLTAALIYVIARRLAGRRAALLALTAAAASAFLIHWAQETRMYAQTAALTALMVYAALRAFDARRENRLAWWIAAGLTGGAAALSHYLGALGVAIVALYALIRTGRAPLRDHVRWLIAPLIAALMFGAWMLYALPLTRSGSIPSDFDAALVFQLSASLLAAGTSVNLEQVTGAAALFALGLFAGLILFTRRAGRRALIVWLFLLVPPLVIYTLGVLQTRFYAPKPEERYLIIFAPVVYAGIGAALAALWRVRRWIGALAAVALLTVYTAALFRDADARYYRDDYSTLFRTLDALAAPNEPVLFVSEDRYPLVLYHLNRAAGWESPLEISGLPPFAAGGVDNLTRALDGRTRFWFVEIEAHFQDPDGGYRAALDAAYTPVLREAFAYNRLTLYDADPDAAPPESDAVLLPEPVSEARPGDTVRAAASGAIIWRYAGEVIASSDAPGWSLAAFDVFPAYPNGPYTIEAGGQTHAFTVTKAQSPLDAAAVPANLAADFGPLTLLGYALERDRVRPGESFTVTLYWRADERAADDYTAFAQLLGPFRATGPVWANDDRYPADTPTSRLWPGLVFADRRTLTVPPDMPPGTYEALFGLYRLADGKRLTTADGRDAVSITGLTVTP